MAPTFKDRMSDDADFRRAIFSQYTPAGARKLMNALGVLLPRSEYIHCGKLICESAQHTAPLAVAWPPPPPSVHNAHANGPAATFVAALWHGTRVAAFYNAVTADDEHPLGWREPSLCVEPANFPAPGMHPAPGAEGHVLVCSPCKAKRSRDFLYKLSELPFGVCTTCEKWAIANMAVGQNDCRCGPQGNNVHDHNNNEPRHMHWCRNHEVAFWDQIRIAANTEIDLRERMLRTKAPKKRGHGWTRKKGQGRAIRTPAERRLAHRVGPQLLITTPACYCGQRLGGGRHRRLNADGSQAETDRVRNCVGCNQFVRNS
ncbi:hypothetical protein BDY17DRAFT_325866 [Neohortaea acidophila]|uniref:Uncharacterized protein n=1 Tax=Neohortaea acidophila TaxID=245834 RepID=A0A6A6PNY8_9PEZI|nr:uncharacterized protein BDY17DRAFT_325866 [Neohortaea acidophila]KAF2481153.1 hypothetical protein BDY17DRAFT_325866 [Neohortaea acidophila]